MFQIFLIILAIIAIAVALLGIKVLFGRKFVNMHIEGNKALNKKGIHCVQSMDRNMRKENPHRVSEHRKQLNSSDDAEE
ncbi:MAG: hypothetical protein II200_00265 [Bacteroidaceae bacterium]|nr:hypothetical protein [Bacteroidaceae bacterium]